MKERPQGSPIVASFETRASRAPQDEGWVVEAAAHPEERPVGYASQG